MRGRSLRVAIGALGTILALAAEALSVQGGQPPSAALLNLAIGLTYLYGGLAIWGHEPANRTGALMTAVGLTWFIAPFAHSEIPVVNELGLALEDTPTVLLLALILAYPSGRLTSQVDRVAVAILAVGATGLNILFSTTLFDIEPGPTGLYGGLALATMTTVVIVRRWLIAPDARAPRAPAGPRRRTRLPGRPEHQPRAADRRCPRRCGRHPDRGA